MVFRAYNTQSAKINWKSNGSISGLGHTKALLKKKSHTKRPFFPPCRNWPICALRREFWNWGRVANLFKLVCLTQCVAVQMSVWRGALYQQLDVMHGNLGSDTGDFIGQFRRRAGQSRLCATYYALTHALFSQAPYLCALYTLVPS